MTVESTCLSAKSIAVDAYSSKLFLMLASKTRLLSHNPTHTGHAQDDKCRSAKQGDGPCRIAQDPRYAMKHDNYAKE